MESDEVLRYFIDEAKDTQNDINNLEELHLPNEAEEATDFLHNAGLSDLSNIYQQGQEITERVVNDSVRQRNLTEKQAQTVLSRVRTLNQTLRSRQPRRKQRQDVRDVSWNLETASTGSRSRSATPDSLDSEEILNDRLTPDEDHQLNSLPSIPLNDNRPEPFKTKIKWTISEPLQNKKIHRNDKGNVAHLGSENVILKGYQALTENGSLPRPPQRERSGSDPTTEVHLQPLSNCNIPVNLSINTNNQLSYSHNDITSNDNCSKVYINNDNNDYNEDIRAVSFENFIRENDNNQLQSVITDAWDPSDGIIIDDVSDSEYQYLKPVLYLELVAIFDQYNITRGYVKRKASKNKGGNVFGVNLSTLVMRDMPRPTDNSMVPEIFQSIINQLNSRCVSEEGILRVAGQKHKLEVLCNEIENKFFNNRKEVESLLCQATVHELTGVLKKLLRDLPDPIFTMELFESFYKSCAISNEEDQVKVLNLLVLMLPVEHRNTFRLLLKFFRNIIVHEQQNRMNLHNVAMITAPSFFPPRLLIPKDNDRLVIKNLTREDMVKRINGAAVCCTIMKTMLKAGDRLWVVPNYLVVQAREAQHRAQLRKDLSKDKRIRSGKTKLARSSTQYEPGAMITPRLKRDLFI